MLILDNRLADPDDFYQALIEAHRGLSPAQSATVNAKLILLLANQVGDMEVLAAALNRARHGIRPEGGDETMVAVA